MIDNNDCRWLDRNFGTVCRNHKTHPSSFVTQDGHRIFAEPSCNRCYGCGYEPITPETPAWDDGDDEEELT